MAWIGMSYANNAAFFTLEVPPITPVETVI
jgi:hypothetical protein